MSLTSIANSKNSRAFTLLEVLVAMAIMAVSVSAILQLFGTAMVTSARAESITIATLLARQKMAEMMIKFEKNLAEGKFPDTTEESEGAFDEPYQKYTWHIKTRKVEIPVPPQGQQDATAQLTQMIAKQIGDSLREMSLSVEWNELSQKQEVTVVTHVVKK